MFGEMIPFDMHAHICFMHGWLETVVGSSLHLNLGFVHLNHEVGTLLYLFPTVFKNRSKMTCPKNEAEI